MVQLGLDFQILFEASPEVLLVLLPDAPRFTMVAATGTRFAVTHTTREETIGRGLFEVFPDNPGDPDATGSANLRASLERVLTTRTADTMAVQKYDIRGSDGSFEVRYWSPKNIPVLSDSGEVRYILHRVEDVTELVRASELGEELRGRTRAMEHEVVRRSQELAAANHDLRELNAKLGELDAAKTAFFSNVSHEFRTPLTLMLGPLEEGLSDTSDALGPANRRRLELAHDNALRLLKLVNALLDFSRVEAGVKRESIAQRSNGGPQVDWRIANLPAVHGDPALLRQVVVNRLSNAVKYSATRATPKVEVGALAGSRDEVVIFVRDNGVGFDMDYAANLFGVFQGLHRAEEFEGTASRPDEGAIFFFSLPRGR